MAIDNPVSDAGRAMLTTRTATASMFPPTISSGFEMDLETSLIKSSPDRITEPLTRLDAPLDEGGDSLLADTSDEGGDLDILDDLPGRPRRPSTATSRQASGAED